MKLQLKSIAAIFALVAVMASCNKETEIPVSSITLNSTDLTMTVGDTYQLTVQTEPENATCQEFVFLSNNLSTATVSEEGLVTAVSEGVAIITVSAAKGDAYQNCKVTVKTPGINLSEDGTANCYVVSETGLYKFKPTKGNSSQVVVPASVETLWETYGTDTAPETGSLIKDVKFENGLVYFSTPDEFVQGNAVIAAKDESGKILWSWHIWLVSEIKEITYANNAGVMMDRNLGALSAKPGDAASLGFVYQWGRKDPFPGATAIDGKNSSAACTPEAPERVVMTAETGTIDWTVANPRVFLSYDKNQSGPAQDWHYMESAVTEKTRWAASKTIYDPCPVGWMMPRATSIGIWKTADIPHGVDTPNPDKTNFGITLGEPYCTPATWYPAAGFSTNGKVTAGAEGHYWSFSTTGASWAGGNDTVAGSFKFILDGKIFSADNAFKYHGKSVRCAKE